MKITINQAFAAHAYLAELNLTSFSNTIRIAIFKNVGELTAAIESVQKKMEESKKKMFKGLETEAQEVAKLRDEFNKEETTDERKSEIIKDIERHEAYLQTEKEYMEVVKSYGKDKVELNLASIKLTQFIDGLIESGIKFNALNLQQISFLLEGE